MKGGRECGRAAAIPITDHIILDQRRGDCMRSFELAGMNASRVGQGCMRISALSAEELDRLVRGDLDLGINFFDHADIYGGGECERKFGDLLRADPSLRGKMIIQTKCGIRPGSSYDFSKEHILRSAENSLKRCAPTV